MDIEGFLRKDLSLWNSRVVFVFGFWILVIENLRVYSGKCLILFFYCYYVREVIFFVIFLGMFIMGFVFFLNDFKNGMYGLFFC